MKKVLLGLLLLLGACGGGQDELQNELSVTLVPDKFSGVTPLEVNFSAAVPEGDNEIGYMWNFGTGDTAQGSPSRAYIFKQAGTFPVSVKVSREDQTATADVKIEVTAPPVIPDPVIPKNNAPTVTLKASRTTGKAPLTVNFSATAADPDNDSLTYSWNFGAGETAKGNPTQRHTFAEAGAFTAVVTVTGGRGGTAQAEKRIAVTDPDPQVPPTDPPPVPPTVPENKAPKVSLSANPTEGDAPLTVSFKADASDPEGEPLSYAWDFGNGEKAEGNSSRTLTYTEPGDYTASVTVSDGLAKTSANIKIRASAPTTPPPPENMPPAEVTAIADPPSGTTPLQVEFSASATDADDDTLVYLWDFGDGVISGENPARHTYQKAGTYNASVTVGDRRGGKTREQVTVEVMGGGPGTPDVPFYGEWAWAASSSEETFTGTLSISKASKRGDSGLEEFFVRGGKGTWTYCPDGLEACGAPTGVGRIDILDFGDGETYDIVFSDASSAEQLVAYDEDDRIENEDGAPTFRGGGAWYYDDGSSDDLSFTMVKVANNPQTALNTALDGLTTSGK